MKPTGIFIGRFQPFHNGHMLVVRGMVKMCGRVVIAIGSSQEKGTDTNPYSAEKRRDMIQHALQGADLIPLYDIEFLNIPDMESDEDWARHLIEKVNADGVVQVWTGNEDTEKCFSGMSVEIRKIKEVPGISSTKIRDMIKVEDVDWKEMVPQEVMSSILKIKE